MTIEEGPTEPTPNSPYSVELVGEGQTLPTFAHEGRFYVLGQVGQRYTIRVTNPTGARVEAVISVDGLDVIDGEGANTGKRGYVVMPNSQINIDGFRVSTSHVAAFRFSSVDDSYAGRKGVARNVGVIGVAIFEEDHVEPLILPTEPVLGGADRPYRGDRDGDEYYDDMDMSSAEAEGGATNADAPTATRNKTADRAPGKAQIQRRPPPEDRDYAPNESQPCCGPRTNRPGLGTEYGEQRYSAVGFTRFVRSHPSQPSAYAELRYNNAAGLSAMGVTTGPSFDPDELTRRETAEPFPGQRFSQPPQ